MTRPRKCSSQALRMLAVLLEDPGEWRHGYALCQASGLKAGTVYPLLARLVQRGFLAVRDEQPVRAGRPARRGCRLTSVGVDFARAQVGAGAALLAGAPAGPSG